MELDTGNPQLKLRVQDIQLFFQGFTEPRIAMLENKKRCFEVFKTIVIFTKINVCSGRLKRVLHI